ncbi:hypothetical protein BC937DRAFT_91862 [Endogone sp. FLAS-F59071]|nr:hypothetical protein BC937DRAFT_91862 [Endogone sp. FLAS-F59071]|eukprot:RUS15884.1 hypothetical protein BC937DRAFT_91862 [Endogone sp. FLAS-F59071]
MNTTTLDLDGPGLAFIAGLGRMFYIINPKDSSFATLEEVPDYIAQAIPFFLLSIALELVTYLVARRGEGLKDGPRWENRKYRLNDTVGSIGAGVFQQISRFFMYNILMSTYLYVWNNWRVYSLDIANVSTWIFGFLAVDFSYYWFHRAAHEVNIMWSAHVVHHSSEYYNQSTALRQSVLQTYTSWIFYAPYALMLPPPMFVAHNQFNTLYQYW